MNERARQLFAAIENETIVCDGAMGTLLYHQGFEFDSCFEQLNLDEPERIQEIHKKYIEAGARVIETNTFNANRNKLAKYKMDCNVAAINENAARLAREVAGEKVYVAGSVGPIKGVGDALTIFQPDELRKMFREQIESLVAGGADFIFLETFVDLDELLLAIEVCRQATNAPVAALMAFGQADFTPDGVPLVKMVNKLEEAGVNIIGANCRSGPALHLKVVRELAKLTKLPIAVIPNAGYAQQVEGRYIYQASPIYFGRMAKELRQAGAKLIGGCCGTNYDHVREMVTSLNEPMPPTSPKAPYIEPNEVEEAPDVDVAAVLNRRLDFAEALRENRPFVTVEVEPPRGCSPFPTIARAECLKGSGVHAFNLSDNPLAQVHMDNVLFAYFLRERLDIPVIAHLTCRDKNLIALQSKLMAAECIGIESILALTGDPATIGDQPGAKSVFNTNSIGLVKLINQLNAGAPPTGKKLRRSTNFTIGVAANPNSVNLKSEIKKLEKKIDAGAQYIETQPLFDRQTVETFVESTAHIKLPILLGILPILNFRSALFIHNEIPGMTLSEDFLQKMEHMTPKEAQSFGMEKAKEMIDFARDKVHGFYLIPPLRKFNVIRELVLHINNLK